MKNLIKDIFIYLGTSIAFIAGEIAIFNCKWLYEKDINWSFGINFILVLIILIIVIIRQQKKENKTEKKLILIEAKQDKLGNDVLWFESTYNINKGDILKLVERDSNNIDSFICIAKVEHINEKKRIGITILIKSNKIKHLTKNEANNKNIKFIPLHIDVEDLRTLYIEANQELQLIENNELQGEMNE